jgi:hypothetical protein
MENIDSRIERIHSKTKFVYQISKTSILHVKLPADAQKYS